MISHTEKSCCFTGHRYIPDEKKQIIENKLRLEIGYLAEHGIDTFYAGGALGFDTLAALSVLDYKKSRDIKLKLLLPCPDQCRGWSRNDIDVYEYIRSMADCVRVLSEHYHGGVMHMRNRALVDSSAYCICYWDKDIASLTKGGTLYTVKYAKKLHRTVINLCDDPPEDIQLEFNFR